MPTTVAIEAKRVDFFGIASPFLHLYLVKRVTDAAGRVIDEKVIRGGPDNSLTLVTQSDIDLALSDDARGSATLIQRRHTPIDLGGRDPDAVWSLMAQHADNINRAGLDYGTERNSNTVVASALHTVGINIGVTLPVGVEPDDVPLYTAIGKMVVNDRLVGPRSTMLFAVASAMTSSTHKPAMTACSASLGQTNSLQARATTFSTVALARTVWRGARATTSTASTLRPTKWSRPSYPRQVASTSSSRLSALISRGALSSPVSKT